MARQKEYLGAVPAEESCAALGVTANFDRYALLEVMVHRAALIARYGCPPDGVRLTSEGQSHDFGRYYELIVTWDEDVEVASAYAEAVSQGLARWMDAGFLAPVIYDAKSQAREVVYSDHFDAARRVMVTLERQRVEGFGSAGEAMAIAALRQAYPSETDAVDQLLRQIYTENTARPPSARRVGLFAPYSLIFYPALFNDHRGTHYPKGDVIDVEARELRDGRRYLLVGLGSVRTPDEALDICWEHYARYVVA